MIPALKPVSLDSRLTAAAKLCRRDVIVADVGCDHAQLACFLSRTSKKVIASDVRDGPLEAARRTASETGADNVEVVKSDGLENIDYADDVVICGMGGELIAKIISSCRFLSSDTRFILQPMTKADFLRRFLYKNGFEIVRESAAYDGGKAYAVILARYTGEKREIDEVFALTGKITDCIFFEKIADKLKKEAMGKEKSSDPENRLKAVELFRLAEEISAKSKI